MDVNQKRRVINILVIIGKTASGKDTIVNELITKYGYKRVITYTTRPRRDGEKQDVTYHFVDKSKFSNFILQGLFAEWKVYQTVKGDWYYGTSWKDLENADDKTVIILTPDGYKDIVDKLKEKPKAIYIYANNATIQERLLNRGDNKEEAKRRLEHDNEDFKGIENEVDKIFYNNKNTDINEVVEKIIKWLGE